MRAKHYNRVTDNSIRYNGDIITRSPFQVKHLFGIKKDIFTVQISKKIQSNTIQVESGKYVHGNWNIKGRKLKAIINDDWKTNSPPAIGSIHFNMRRKSVLNSHLKIHQKTVSAEPKLMEDLGYFDYITYSFDSPKKPTSSSPKNYRRMQTPSVHSACYHATPRRKSLGLQASDFLH